MHQRQFQALLGVGCLALLLLWAWAARTGAALAQPLPPRPDITATPVPTPAPTAAPKPRSDDDPAPAGASGRITGTVIDLTTGAPAAGITVLVGDARVTSDASGNYDRSALPADSYVVQLALPAERGAAAQGPITVALEAGATVVQHLAFRSPLAPTAAPAPTATAVVPARLPDTGAPAGGGWLWPAALLALVGLGALLARRAAHA